MLDLVLALAVTNIITLVLFARSVDRGDSGEKQYNIVSMDGEVLQGPLSLKKAMRAQEEWDNLCVWHDGPRTTILPVRKK